MSSRIAIITSNYWPEQTGISRTSTDLAEYFAAHDAQVTVATAMPYYPEWRVYEAYRKRLFARESHGGVEILRAWHFVRPAPSTLGRLLHELTLAAASIPNVLRAVRRANAVYVVTPMLSLAFVAVLCTRILGKRPILVVQDVMPDAAVELGMLRNKGMIALSRWMARVCYRAAREIHTLGEGMMRRIVNNGGNPATTRVVPVTVDLAELSAPSGENDFRRQFCRPGQLAVLHTGNMGKKQDLGLVLDTAALLAGEPDVHFFVFGDGAVREEFLKRREDLGLHNVSHYPLQERALLPHMLVGADIVLVSQLPEMTDIAVPSKLITAMAAGAFVVAACSSDSETARIVERSQGGIVIPPSDPHAFVRTIHALRSGSINPSAYRARARAHAAQQYDRDKVYGPLTRAT